MPTFSAKELVEGKTARKWYNNPNWEVRVAAYRRKYGNQCTSCKRTNAPTSLHHFVYTRTKGVEYWNAPDEELGLLCKECHTTWHKLVNAFCLTTGRVPVVHLRILLGALSVLTKKYDSNELSFALCQLACEPETMRRLRLIWENSSEEKP